MLIFTRWGGAKPWHGSFGEKIRDGARKHTGIDIFAKIGTPVYACVKSEVVTVEVSESMYGGTICLKVLDSDTFKNKRNHSFVPKYSNKTEIAEGPEFSHEGQLYCFYAHLSQMDVKKGDIVNAGDIIALSGTSGDGGKTFRTRNPHLHFEIRSTKVASGLNNKCNPCIYVDCKYDEMLSEEERRIQIEEAKEDYFQSHQTKL